MDISRKGDFWRGYGDVTEWLLGLRTMKAYAECQGIILARIYFTKFLMFLLIYAKLAVH